MLIGIDIPFSSSRLDGCLVFLAATTVEDDDAGEGELPSAFSERSRADGDCPLEIKCTQAGRDYSNIR